MPIKIKLDYYDTDKVEGGLMMLFFGLVFPLPSSPENFSVDALSFSNHLHTKLFKI